MNLGMVVHTCDSNTWEEEAGESRFEAHSQLHSVHSVRGQSGLPLKKDSTSKKLITSKFDNCWFFEENIKLVNTF